jgi:cell division protein FtsZ
MFFDIQPEDESIIKVVGVGGGGSNAVNFMFKQGIEGVNFIICNTDQQALASSEVPVKIQLGPSLTGGRGAGAKPEIGKQATIESEEEIRKALGANTQMVFVTAGMGGGTGTGGAPEVAKIAKEMGILTVGIVTIPFAFEGRAKFDKAHSGLDELRSNVDALIVISNNKLREIYGNLSLTAAFSHADNVLATAARGISEIITKPGIVNVDFEDVKTVMKDSGVAIMGIGVASGEGRAIKAIDAAMSSPLLNENDIYGAIGVLLYISSGTKEVTMDEVSEIISHVQQASSNNTEIIWGLCQDDSLEDEVSVTLIATGFNTETPRAVTRTQKVVGLDEAAPAVKAPAAPLAEEKQSNTVVLDLELPQLAQVQPTDAEEEVMETTPTAAPSIAEEVIFTVREIKAEVTPQKAQPAEEQSADKRPDRADMAREIMRRRVANTGRLRDTNYLHEIERTPSIERRNRKFENVPHSSESHRSRITLVDNYEEENGDKIDIKMNSYLNDRPD